MKKFLSILTAAICITVCAFSFTACGNNFGDNAHTSHNWSATYTQDGDRHYQICDGCNEKKYGEHDYGTSGTCVCGKTKPEETVVATGVTLNKNTLALEVNGTETLTAAVAPENATDKSVTWESDKTNIATVDNTGKVTAVAEGTAVITVKTANNKTTQCTVTVSAAVVPVTGVTLDKTALTLYVDETANLTATVAPENATDKTVSYSVEPAGVVTVDNDGNVTAVAAGTAIITATAGSKTATCTVTVNAPLTNAQVIAALNGKYKEAAGKSCFPSSFKYNEYNVSNERWYVSKNDKSQIISTYFSCNLVNEEGNGYFVLAEVNFETPIDIKDLSEGNLPNATYNRLYRVNYLADNYYNNPNYQKNRKDLCDAICEKAFETNGTVQNRYLIDAGSAADDSQLTGTVRSFQVIEVTDKGVQQAYCRIQDQNVENDAGYIAKLNNGTSGENYRVYDKSSKAITGTLVENNNEPFGGTKEN